MMTAVGAGMLEMYRTSGFNAYNDSVLNRIGINLSQTEIQPGQSITETTVVIFGNTIDTPDLITDLKDRFLEPVNITQQNPEKLTVFVDSTVEYNNYNRNESLFMTSNISFNPWNVTVTVVNATFDNGTAGTGDDITIELYDDGRFKGHYLVGVEILGLEYATFFGEISTYVRVEHLMEGVYKSMSFGIIISWVSCYMGYYTGASGFGAEGVSKSTTQAVVVTAVMILVWNYFMTAFLF